MRLTTYGRATKANVMAQTYPSFTIYLDNAGQYRWRCQAANHKTIADSSEGYHNYRDCKAMIAVVGGAASNIWQTNDVTARNPNG